MGNKKNFFRRNEALNTFIGNASPEISSAQDLADLLQRNSSDASPIVYPVEAIKNFNINSSNIECHLALSYYFRTGSFWKNIAAFDQFISYYIDSGGKCFGTVSQTFYLQTQLKNIYFPSIEDVNGIRAFRGLSLEKLVRFERLTILTNNNDPQTFQSVTNTMTRLYLGNCQTIGDNTLLQNFKDNNQGLTIYFGIDLATINGGSPHPDIVQFTGTYGGTAVYVDNYTKPNRVTDLSDSNITANSVDLNFTPPASTNALSFYEVWIDDGTNNPIQLYTAFDEITNSGNTLNGLTSGTTYKIKIYACDIYWNRSLVSNEIEIITL